MKRRILASAAAALVALGAGAQARAACQMAKLVELPVTMDGLRPHVAAKINGHDTTMLVDIGAFFSNLSDEAAERFGLKATVAPFGLEIRGVGGATRSARAVRADDFNFAGAGFKNIQFLVGGRVGEGDTAGVIGMNIMGPFDVEFDFANGVMRFFKAKDCGDANLAYWSKGMALSRIDLDAPGPILQHVEAKAYLNGRQLKVLFDTGAPLSVMSLHAAARVGVTVGGPGVVAAGTSHGIYGGGTEAFLAPFDSFKIGDEEIKNTRLRMADLRLGDEQDMLLGADFFLSHRVLISNTQKKLYFTYNGGPVFRLDGGPKVQAQAQAAAPAGGPAAGGGSTAENAVSGAELQRRGQAALARREFAVAIDDFGKAIAAEPNEASHYKARAVARLGNRQPVMALSDLDQALKLKPDDVQALTIRGGVYIANRDMAHARADFDAALKLAPENAELPVEIAGAYARAGQFDPALQQLDGWIAAHPKSLNLAQVRAVRCWTRAVAGKDLDKALADCDLALREERTSVVMQDRGLVLLRMGRLDEAIVQFGAALKLQPKSAAGLYGRGLAELKKGDKTQGEADIGAAAAIAPGLPAEYRRYGLGAEGGPPARDKAGG